MKQKEKKRDKKGKTKDCGCFRIEIFKTRIVDTLGLRYLGLVKSFFQD